MTQFALLVATVVGFCLTAALGNMIVPLRTALKPPQQPETQQPEIRQSGAEAQPPEAESAPEPRTPCLGGLCAMVAVLAAAGISWTAACAADMTLLNGQHTTRLLCTLGGALAFGAVGAADDIVRIRGGGPLGLRRAPRLALEAGAAALLLLVLYACGWLATGLTVAGVGYIELGVAALPLWWLVLIALAECARVAGTADGTVCGTAFVAMLGLIFVLTLLGWPSLAVLPAAMAGALLALLIWDFPPSKLRIGSAGCLFAAGAIGCVPLCVGWPELSVPLALPFWLEGGMVALQIIYARLTGGKMLFGAAPLHRWLQKRGTGAAGVFYILCALAMAGAAFAALLAQS